MNVKYLFLCSAVTFLLSACEPERNRPFSHKIGDSIMHAQLKAEHVYFTLADGALVSEKNHKPQGFYLEGYVKNGVFEPSSEVLGIDVLSDI